MYPKNAASPEPIAIGAVVQISDGAVQTSGCTVRIKPIGVAEADGAGTTGYSTDGVVLYTPTQAETNYTSFVLIAKKTGCIPVSVTVVPTASATAGTVKLATTINDAILQAALGLASANIDTQLSALSTAIAALNNLSALANLYGSLVLEIPDSSTTQYAFTLVVHDQEGKLVDLDSSPTIAAANAAGTDRSSNLSAVSHPATGRYTFTYGVASTAAEESLRITCSGTVSSEGRYVEWVGSVVNYDTLTTLLAVKAKTDLIPASPAATGDIPSANSIATALLDLSNGVETGITVRQFCRAIGAVLAGTLTGAGTTTLVFKSLGGSTTRITATVTTAGNRPVITLSL